MPGLVTRGFAAGGPLVTRGFRTGAAPDLRAALNTYLRADAQLAALVGTRINPLFRPQGVGSYPAVTLRVVSNRRGHDLVGPSGYGQARVQLDVWALQLSDCVAVKRRLESLLDGAAGTLGGLRITEVRQESESDLPEWPDDGTSQPIERLKLDYFIRYSLDPTTMPS